MPGMLSDVAQRSKRGGLIWKKIHEILTHRKRICKIRIHRMTAPGTCGMSCVHGCKPGGLPISGQRDRGTEERTSRLSGNRTAQDRQTRRIVPQKEKTPRTQGHPGAGGMYRDTPDMGSRTGDSGGAAGGRRFEGQRTSGRWFLDTAYAKRENQSCMYWTWKTQAR